MKKRFFFINQNSSSGMEQDLFSRDHTSVLFNLLLSAFYLWWLLLCKQVLPCLNGTLGHFPYRVWLKQNQGSGLDCLAGGCTTLLWCAHPPFWITLSLYCFLSCKESFSKFSNTSHLVPLAPLSECVLNSSLFAESWHSGFPVIIVCKWKAHISHAIFSTVLLNCNIEKKSVLFKCTRAHCFLLSKSQLLL